VRGPKREDPLGGSTDKERNAKRAAIALYFLGNRERNWGAYLVRGPKESCSSPLLFNLLICPSNKSKNGPLQFTYLPLK